MLNVLAVLCSDLHISKCPSARSAEPSWFLAMQRSVDELKGLADDHKCPVIIAGDIFDRYDVSPEVINWAIRHLPKSYAVRGNHDLPYHRHDQINRSAYQTLVEAGTIIDLQEVTHINGVHLHPFPWGKPVTLCPEEWIDHLSIQLAVVHQYIWKEGYGHPGATDESRATAFRSSLVGYDASVWGDNHKGFLIGKPGDHYLMNCGTFFRRKSDEIDYKPQVGLLLEDGSIQPHFLSVEKDLFIETKAKSASREFGVETAAVLASLYGLGKDALDFRQAVDRYLADNKVEADVSKFVLSSIAER